MGSKTYIYKFNAEVLLQGEHDYENKIIKCSSLLCEMAGEVEEKSDSLLFYQLKNRYPSERIEHLICIIDFSKLFKFNAKSKDKFSLFNELIDFSEGFELNINSIDQEDGSEIFETHTIRIKDFLKSNSMSKQYQVYYINSREDFYEDIKSVCYFGFDKKSETQISKLYAYSGTLCSDVTILDGIKFNENELVVIDDFEEEVIVKECITGISEQSLYNHIKSNKEIDKKILDCYFEAIDYLKENNNDVDTIVSLLSDYKIKSNDELIAQYRNIGTKSSPLAWKQIKVRNYPVNVNLFDGEGLILFPYFRENFLPKLKKKYKTITSIQVRMPYVKGMLHTCDFQSFFKEHNIQEIKCIDGYHKVDQIKVILTSSMFKCLKFITSKNPIKWYLETINRYNYPIGIVAKRNSEKETVNLQYQYLSTLPLTEKTIRDLICQSNEFINKECSEENILKSLSDTDTIESYAKKICDNSKGKEFFISTSTYIKKRNDKFESLKNDALFSRFPVRGSQKYLSGDLLELLFKIIGEKLPFEEKLNDEYFVPSANGCFAKAVILRSPHYSRNEIVVADRNIGNELRNRYFSHLDSVLMFDARTMYPNRVGGADYDGDLVIAVTEAKIVDSCLNIMDSYPVVIIPSLKAISKPFTYEFKLRCFDSTFSSSVGHISNNALYDLTKTYKDDCKDDKHDKIGFYSVLNGLEIDSVKSGKKPALAELIDDKDQNIQIFIKAKNENNDVKGSRGGIKELNELISKKDITFDSNILNVYKYANDIIQLKEPITKKVSQIASINSTESAEIFAIVCLYHEASRIITKVLSKNGKIYAKNLSTSTLMIINEILKNQNVDIDNLISYFEINSSEAYKKLNYYLTHDTKFHFLKNPTDKKSFLNNMFDSLDSNIIDLLSETDNENYRLLYFILLNIKTRTNTIEFYNSKDTKHFANSIYEDVFNNFYNSHKIELEQIVSSKISCNVKKIKKCVDQKLSEYASKYSWEQISSCIDIFNNELVFSIFGDMLLEHFMEENDNE